MSALSFESVKVRVNARMTDEWPGEILNARVFKYAS